MLQKQAVDISFAKGLDTKTDPWRLEVGSFSRLKNSVFTTTGMLKPRNGFNPVTSLPEPASFLTTFSGNLTAVGNSIQAYSSGTENWVTKGELLPLDVAARSVARSALNIIQCDAATSSSGFICTAYTEADGGDRYYKYTIQDANTGQNIVAPTELAGSSGEVTGSPRVFVLGGYFIIAFTVTISATAHLQYIAVSINSPETVSAPVDIAGSYVPSNALSWDGAVFENRLYFAYNTTSGGQSIQVTYLRPSLGSPVAAKTYAGQIATNMSVCVDTTSSTQPIVVVSYYDSASQDGYMFAVDVNLNPRMSVTQIITNEDVYNITAASANMEVSVFYEVANSYFYNSSYISNYTKGVTVSIPSTVTTGTVSSAFDVLRSTGIASKAFLADGVAYALMEYASLYQPTYFLVSASGGVFAKVAYEEGGASLDPSAGYLPLGLPNIEYANGVASTVYLFKTLIETTGEVPNSNGSGAPNVRNVYAQTGVNRLTMTFSADRLTSSEIAGNLNISGGFLLNYDGQTLSENGFHLYPDDVEVAAPPDPTPTGDVTISDRTITNVSSIGFVAPGMNVSGTGIPANTTVVSVDFGTSEIVIDKDPTATNSGVTLTFTGNMSLQAYYYVATYEWTDAAGNIVRSAPSIPKAITVSSGSSFAVVYVPTLRITAKEGVKIVIYRWSAAQQTYYRVTSLQQPLLNDKSVDYVFFTDIASDSEILGNTILYTTGGVLENTGGPAVVDVTLFDNRLWGISAEDRNLLVYSKQVIPAVPVEMSDLLSIYVAPTAGSQGSTGEMTCIFPMDDKLIIFKQNALYYINGSGPDNTGANSTYSEPIFITASVGCVNKRSIALIPQGLVFQSDKGIWLLGRGLDTTYIGAPVEAYNALLVNSAVSIPGTTQVRFTMPGSLQLMYDYFYNQWGTFEGAGAISSTLYQGQHAILSAEGLVSKETPGSYLDNSNPVLLGFTTGWLNLAGLQGYQRIYYFYLLGKFYSPHKLNVRLAYDYNESPEQSSLISPTNFAGFYGDSSPYGQEDPYGGPGDVENWRVFPARGRCSAVKISVDEVYDPAFGVPAGKGLTLSGINLVAGIKKGYRPIAAKNSIGGGVNRG